MAATDAVDVRRLRRSALVAGVGDGIVAVALPLLAAGVTRDPLAVAGVIAAQHLPWPLLAVALPRLAAIDRRTLVGAGDSVRAVAVAFAGLVAVIGNETILTIQLVALVIGVAQAITDDAERVGGEALTDRAGDRAHAALTGAGVIGVAVLGLPLGGLLYELLAPIPLLFDVGVFAIAALLALAVRRPLVETSLPADDAPVTGLPHLASGSGVVTAAASVLAASAGGVAGVLVLIALDDLGLGAPAFGLFLAGLAASSAIGALLAPSVAQAVGLRSAIVLGLVAAAAAHAGAWALLDPELPYPAVGALGAGTAGAMASTVLLRAWRHGATSASGPEGVRAFHLSVWAATPSGAAAGGLIARANGPAAVLLVAAVGCLVSAGLAVAVGAPGRRPAHEPQKVS